MCQSAACCLVILSWSFFYHIRLTKTKNNWRLRKQTQLPLCTRERNCLSICTPLVEAHFLPTAVPFPMDFELPLPQLLPSLRNREGTVPTHRARGYIGQSIGKRACHHFSRPIGRRLVRTKAAPLRRDVTKRKGPTSRGKALVPVIVLPFPRFSSLLYHLVVLPFPSLPFSYPFSCSALCASDVSPCFFAPRNRLPVGRMYRYVLSNTGVYTYVSANLNTRCVRIISILMRINYVWYMRENDLIWLLEILRNRDKTEEREYTESLLSRL